jgi:hypothetical protein
MKQFTKTAFVCLVVLALLASVQVTWAQEPVSFSPLALVGVGGIVINGSVALANTYSLVRGTPNHTNGSFGLGLGAVTTVVALAGLVTSSSGEESTQFWLVLGSAGIASAVAGGLNMRAATGASEAAGQRDGGPLRVGASFGRRVGVVASVSF